MKISDIFSKHLTNKGLSVAWLGRQYGVTRQAMNSQLTDSNSFTTDFIIRVSEILNHNFFYDIALWHAKEIDKKTPSEVKEDMVTYGNTVPKSEYEKVVNENLSLKRELMKLYDKDISLTKKNISYKKM